MPREKVTAPTIWGDRVHLTDALDGLALNPALPAGLLHRLVAHRTGTVTGRPGLPEDVLDRILADDDRRQLSAVVRNPALPDRVRLRLAGHPDASVRSSLVVGWGAGAPRELLDGVAADPDPRERADLARRQALPVDVVTVLAADADPRVRAAVARWQRRVPETVRRALLTDPADEVRARACPPHGPLPLPPDLVPALLADPVTRAGAARCAVLDRETADRLARDPDVEVRAQLAGHPDLPADLRDRLGTDLCATVRLGVFARQDTPEPLRAAIHDHLCHAPDPLDLLDTDDEDDVELDRVVAAVLLGQLRLPWVTATPAPHVTSPYPSFRTSAAQSRDLPDSALRVLLADPDSEVRTAAAQRAPHLLDAVTAERVDRGFDPVKRTDWRPADLVVFAPQVLRRFATDPDPRMRCLAPRDPHLPAELAGRLAADTEPTVRHAVAGHRCVPVDALVALLYDDAAGVVRAAAGSPVLPVEWELLLQEAGL